MAEDFSNDAVDDYLTGSNWEKHPAGTTIVVGSGVGGLTCASLLAQTGKRVIVLERQNISGGATHQFVESGFRFEMGLQDVGAEVWKGKDAKEPGARLLDAATGGGVTWEVLKPHPYAVHVEGRPELKIRGTWAETRKELIDRFPDETAAIDKYHSLVMETREAAKGYALGRIQHPSRGKSLSSSLFSKFSGKDRTGVGADFDRLSARTVAEVLGEITKNQELSYVLTFLWGKYALPPQVASWGAHALVAGQYMDGAAYPVSGAGALETAMVQLIVKNGGKVFVNSKVRNVLIDTHGVCYGVLMENTKIIRAETVVSAIGAANTYERLIPAPNADLVSGPLAAIRELKWSSYAALQVFVGLDGDAEELGINQTSHWFLPSNPDHTSNAVRYFLDPSFTSDFPYVHVSFPSTKSLRDKEGKSTAVIFAAAHYDWFKGMQQSDVKLVADEIVARLSAKFFARFPQLRTRVKFIQLATPLSHEFHLGSSRGTPYGLGHSTARFHQEWLKPQTPVKGLVLAGQDVFTCSVVGATVGGFMAAAQVSEEVINKYRCCFE